MSHPSLGARLSLFFRFARVQFLPVIIAPIVVGTAASWDLYRSISPGLLFLLLVASASLLIASNSIDDVYDYLNGVDQASERLFPKDFPGWKPIPRGLMSVSQGFAISFCFYSLSLAIGVYLAVVVGWLAVAIAIPGILLSYFYVAPPLKLDYRGLGLGEISIFLGFGPIPALGAFYVLTGSLSALPVLVSVPSGILTVNVLLVHDMIFYDSYKEAGKRSLTVVLGRVRAERLTFGLAGLAYAFVLVLVVVGYLPLGCAAVLLALPILFARGGPSRGERPVPQYADRAQGFFFHSVVFSALLALGLIV